MQLFKEPLLNPPTPAPTPKKQRKPKIKDTSRRFGLIAIAIAAVIIGAATLRSHFILAAKAPGDMPANSRWLLTGRDANTNVKLGLWVACWMSPTKTADHCRIADQDGAAQFDGDMLPLDNSQPVVPDEDLQVSAIDPTSLWMSGVHGDMPVPMLLLNNGTHLVPVSEREGLQKRMARGDWRKGRDPADRGVGQQQ